MSDYEDAVMAETAVRSEMDCIVTRNIKDFEAASLKIYQPDAFLILLETSSDDKDPIAYE